MSRARRHRPVCPGSNAPPLAGACGTCGRTVSVDAGGRLVIHKVDPAQLGHARAEAAPVEAPAGYRLTGHARARAREMGVTAAELRLAVEAPEVTYPLRKYPDCQTRAAGRVAVPVRDDEPVILTVLWRCEDARWSDDAETA